MTVITDFAAVRIQRRRTLGELINEFSGQRDHRRLVEKPQLNGHGAVMGPTGPVTPFPGAHVDRPGAARVRRQLPSLSVACLWHGLAILRPHHDCRGLRRAFTAAGFSGSAAYSADEPGPARFPDGFAAPVSDRNQSRLDQAEPAEQVKDLRLGAESAAWRV